MAAATTPQLTLKKAEHAFETDLPGSGQRLVYGMTDLGRHAARDGQAACVLYYPKTILGNAFDAKSVIGEDLPWRSCPCRKAGRRYIEVLARGKPLPDSEITVILPGRDPEGRQNGCLRADRGIYANRALRGLGTFLGNKRRRA